MQEIKKRRIVLASVLKPVNDPRMHEKMAVSLCNAGFSDIHVIGMASGLDAGRHASITLHPHQSFRRLSLSRILAPWTILFKALRIKPALFIAATHELLITAVILKVVTGCSIIYDVQEDYYKNIVSTNAFPLILRYPIAWYVRTKEKICSPFISTFLLAEQCYSREISFVAKHNIVLENKCLLPDNFRRTPDDSGVRLLFSGTLAESTGIFLAIALAERLHEVNTDVKLHIIGFCPHLPTRRKLVTRIKDKPFIELTGGDELQPYSHIVDAIRKANFGIISYPLAAHTKNRTPTKFFEYMASGLPILRHEGTTAIPDAMDGIIPFDIKNIEPAELLERMKHARDYGRPSAVFMWDKESERLVQLVTNILQGKR